MLMVCFIITLIVIWLWYYVVFLDGYERKPPKILFKTLGKDARQNTRKEGE